MSIPSIVIEPDSASRNLKKASARVDFPDPVQKKVRGDIED